MNDNKKTENCQSIVFAVYVIWCAPTNKFYVGVTRQKYVATRIRQHRRGKKQFIDKEIKKIGWEGNFDYWIVEENIPSNQISDCEKRWVEFFGSVYPHGYNKTFGGIGHITVSDDTREKISKAALARDLSGENNPMYGRHHTEEAKASISAKLSGENSPMYGKSPTNKGVPHTPEELAKMSATQTGEKMVSTENITPKKRKKKTDRRILASQVGIKVFRVLKVQKQNCAKKHLKET